jgi:EAL domain-containing protein (putative c-di-GMP-specific phosphodiesterase class I)
MLPTSPEADTVIGVSDSSGLVYPFQLYAQPIFTAACSSLVAVELLARADDSDGEMTLTAVTVLRRARHWRAETQLDRQVTAAAAALAAHRRSFAWSANLSPWGLADVVGRDQTPPPGVWWEIDERVQPAQVPRRWLARCRSQGAVVVADDVSDPDVAADWIARGVRVVKVDRAAAGDRRRLAALLRVCASVTVVVEGVPTAWVHAAWGGTPPSSVLVQSFEVAAPRPLGEISHAVSASGAVRH